MDIRTLPIDSIVYKRKKYDQGVILGSRPWKWTLGNKYSPCIARRVDNNLQVSMLSPHKQNFQVYISKHTLEVGDVYKIVNHEYGKERVESLYKILAIESNTVKVDVLEENIVKLERKVKPLSNIKTDGPLLFTDEWEKETECVETLSEKEQANFDELMNFFDHPEEEQQQTDHGALPAKVSPEVIEDIDKDTLPLPSDRIMVHEKFVNGKNQIGFGFLMVNEGKQQMSMFAAPAAITSEPRPEPKVEPRPEPKVEPIKGFSPAEIAILDAMRKGAEHIDEIIQESGLNAGTVAGVLLMMELGGHIKQKPGRYFARA